MSGGGGLEGNGKTVALDFDGVICEPYGGRVLPGSEYLLHGLHVRGYTVVIHTCNVPERVWAWLGNNNLAHLVDYVTHTKPPAVLYVDDRGYRYDGRPEDAARVLACLDTGHSTWWEREGKTPSWTHDMVHPSSGAIRPVDKIGGQGE